MGKRKFTNITAIIIIITSLMCILNTSDLNNVNATLVQEPYGVGTSVYYGAYFQNCLNDNEKECAEKILQGKDIAEIGDGRWICNSAGKYYKSEPIEWIVLKEETDSLLMISKKVLTVKSLGSSINEKDQWISNSGREWLNSGFLTYGFNAKEREDILESQVSTHYMSYDDWRQTGKGLICGADEGDRLETTNDKVFLLDKYEFEELLSQGNRIAYATLFANEKEEAVDWWLRGPATWVYGNLVNIYVKKTGELDENRRIFASAGTKGLRPVIRVKKYSSNLFNEKPEVPIIGEGDIVQQNRVSGEVAGTYKDGATKKIITEFEKYSDEYFFNSSSMIQGELAKLSMLASSAVYNKIYSTDLMEACFFKTNYYYKAKPSKKKNDTVSFDVGIKKVEDKTIVAVWVKGTSADYEWVSNWNLGKGKTHKGFLKAEKGMNASIKQFLKDNKITLTKKDSVKFWITGHSRGAAVANLYAKRMNETIGKENVYAYTFATPRVSTVGKKVGYENIFNYLNPGDFVTEVAPVKWNYKRYGVDITLRALKKGAMKKYFRKQSGKEYRGFSKKGKKSLVNAFIKYAGEKVSGYYKKKPTKTPEFFCKKGLGYILAGKYVEGLKNCLSVTAKNGNALKVFGKMVYDGKFSEKFGFAHTQCGYLSWLKQMY